MIELRVEDYCQNGCSNFEPKVERIKRNEYCGDTHIDTYVCCRYKTMCSLMKKYLEGSKDGDKTDL